MLTFSILAEHVCGRVDSRAGVGRADVAIWTLEPRPCSSGRTLPIAILCLDLHKCWALAPLSFKTSENCMLPYSHITTQLCCVYTNIDINYLLLHRQEEAHGMGTSIASVLYRACASHLLFSILLSSSAGTELWSVSV